MAEQDMLRDGPRIAIVGGGAAGITAAASAALACDGEVVLFESADDLLKLQMGTDQRKLDPHIYNWPRGNSDDPIADLPLLGWDAGPSKDVREDVVRQFEEIAGRTRNLSQRKRHKVTAIKELDGGGYQLTALDLGAGVERTDAFQIIILAFGFGLEATETVRGIGDKSYWDNAGIPGAEIRGRANPHYFVSGSGDGGLIDFVAAAFASFNHAALIRTIATYPNRKDLEREILAIESEARVAQANGNEFNLFQSYTDRIDPLIEANGLVAEIARKLRPGVQMTLQTRDKAVFTLGSAVLNRLATFATIRACQTTAGHAFRHIACDTVSRVAGYTPAQDDPTFQLDCDGELITADEVIIRRGTDRKSVREPFTDLLGDYEQRHEEWLARLGAATLVPVLSNDAQDFFREKAREAHLTGSRRLTALAAASMPMMVHLSIDGTDVQWSSDRGADRIGEAWSDGTSFNVTLRQAPSEMGPIGGAMLRVAVHASNVVVHAEPLDWAKPWELLTSRSPHASGMAMPKLIRGNPGGGWQVRQSTGSARLAAIVHRELDSWVLARIDNHLNGYLLNQDDPAGYVGLEIAPDLRALMRQTWKTWQEAFTDEPALLSRFLRLMVSATDEDGDAVQVLVGPRKLSSIIGGTALSLAIASVWGQTAPRSIRPGNLLREIAGNERTGHGCAPDRILGKRPGMCASTHDWHTNFVLLALEGRLDLARKAEEPFATIGAGQPSLAETAGSGPMMMWLSQELIQALTEGVTALTTLLEQVEHQHSELLLRAIERKEETV
ncbi:ABC-three component system protein [Rhizobium sp. F40D2]|uniref:ABC-three component system protein n=1 Tax=Rhizobium sp. F40D2 TaxID=3453141 RepID=UPI003F2167CF